MSNPIVRLARQQILRLLDGQRIQVPTSVGLLVVEAKADDHWHPLKKLPDMPPHILAIHERVATEAPTEVWRNDLYEVMVFEQPGLKHLSIKRLDRAAVRNWRHFQQIKNEVAGEFLEGMELFPSEARVADNANQYHLWVLTEEPIPLGFQGGMVTITDEDVEHYNASGTRGRQEPMQPGVTVGAKMQTHQETEGIDTRKALDEITSAALDAMGGRG